MFTGIIEERGEIVSLKLGESGARLTVRAPLAVSDARHGASIAVAGMCLTVVEIEKDTFAADVMQISLDTSTIGGRSPGESVNIERSMVVGDRLGGHIVQGHLDGTATVTSVTDGPGQRTLRFALPAELTRFVAQKGSIALDGVSLTVSAVGPVVTREESGGEAWFEVSLIPETLAATTLGDLAIGDCVNVETDIVARHVERMLEGSTA